MKALWKAIASIALCLLAGNIQAQLIIRPAVPRLGIIQKSQLWNLLIINPLPSETEISISLVLQDRQNGYTLMTAQSGNIKVPKGSKQLNEQAVFPVQYRYETLFNSNNQQALLPVGNYLACYSVVSSAKQESVAQECVAIDVAPLSPPQLMYPANGSQIVEHSPQLSWIPPTPAILFSQLRYDISVTEVFPGQSAVEAIQRNTPLYVAGSIPQQSISYPSSATSLDTGKLYAWQIIAKNGESYAAKSDVWTFSLLKNTSSKSISASPYIKMSSEVAAPGWAEEGFLKIEYMQESADHFVTIEINNLNNPGKTLKTVKVESKYGQNFIEIDFNKYLHLKEGECFEALIHRLGYKPLSLRFFARYSQKN